MDITSTTLGFVGLGAVTITVILAWTRRRPTMAMPAGSRSQWPVRPGSRRSYQWFGGDPVYFYGGDAGSADCGAGADAGGASCG